MPKKQQTPGSCIFCEGKGNLTKEHVFPEWIQKIIPKTGVGSKHLKYDGRFVPEKYATNKVVHQGDMGTRTIRRFCVSCNGGWMSKLEVGRIRDLFKDGIRLYKDKLIYLYPGPSVLERVFGFSRSDANWPPKSAISYSEFNDISNIVADVNRCLTPRS